MISDIKFKQDYFKNKNLGIKEESKNSERKNFLRKKIINKMCIDQLYQKFV